MNKNLIQNIIIVVLIFTSFILLSIRLELLIFLGNQSAIVSINRAEIEYKVRPNSISFRMGKENTKKIFDKNGMYYKDLAKVIKTSIASLNSVEKISHESYKKKKDSKGIQLNFSPDISQRLLYGSLFLEEGSIGDFVKIQELWIPQTYDTSLYIKSDGDYYELKNSEINTILGFDNFVDLGRGGYYSLHERFPEFTDNDVLIAEEIKLNTLKTQPMFTDDDIDMLGRAILGQKYDFANRISQTDGGFIIDYNYGAEVIKLMSDGKVFYHQDFPNDMNKTSEFDAVNIALNFVSQITKDNIIITVEDARKTQINGKDAYEIFLSQRIDGVRLSYRNNEPTIKVLVVADKVHSMKGLFRNVTESIDNSLSLGENAVIFILEQNYEYIKSKEPFKSTRELFDMIKTAEYAYVYDSDGDFTACYKMVIGDSTFLFRLEDAEVM